MKSDAYLTTHQYASLIFSNAHGRMSLQKAFRTIQVTGTDHDEVDGMYKHERRMSGLSYYESGRHCRWNGREAEFYLGIGEDGDWVISCTKYYPDLDDEGEEFDWVLWKCPHSANLMLPPKEGWVAVDKLAKGCPKLSYHYTK